MLWVELNVNKFKDNGGCSHSFDNQVVQCVIVLFIWS